MEWTPFTAWNWIAAGVVVVFVALAWRTLRALHGPSTGRRRLWLALRGVLLVILLAILLHPHRVQRREFRKPLDVAVVLDDSASMTLRDGPGTAPRLDQLKEDARSLRGLAGDGVRLRWYRFAGDAEPVSGPEALTATGRASRIGKVLETVLGDERTRDLGAVILVSDGQTLDPDAARKAARLYRQADVPLYTRLVGTPDEAPDLRLSDLAAAQQSLYSPRVRLTGTLQAAGFVGRNVLLRVHCEGRAVHTSFEAVEEAVQPFERTFDTPFTGFHHYQVEVRPEEGERLADNNEGVVGADVPDRKIRVIYMEGTRRATHFLENALESDPDIEVTSLFFPQSRNYEAAGGGKLEVPEEMLDHPVMALGTTRDETARIWGEEFPGFAAHNSVNRAKPGAQVLAYNASRSNDYGPLVFFAVQQIGRGRTMAFTSDTTAVWGTAFHTRFGTEKDATLYYRRFWNQAVRWLAADRIRRKSGELRVNLDRSVAVPGESVEVRIPFPPSLPDAVITLNREVSGEEPTPVKLIRDEVTRTWQTEVPMATEGEWIFTARMGQPSLEPLFACALVNVIPDTREHASTSANRDLMAELATIGGGQSLEDDAGVWSVDVEAICHELLHFQDFKRFKPITGFKSSGLAEGQSKHFQPVVKDLVNIISHEYVKNHLEQFGYAEPLTDNAESRMKNMASGLAALEKNFVSVSQQLVKLPGKKGSLGMTGLQTVYQNLLLMTLRDQLLFDGAYASDIDEMVVRFQAILDFIHQNTSEDPRFKKVYLEVQEPARSIRTSCKEYQRSSGSTEERYSLLKDSLDHVYDHVGISFELISRPSEAPILKATSATFRPGESFLLDGQFNFSDVRIFVPAQPVEPVERAGLREPPAAGRKARYARVHNWGKRPRASNITRGPCVVC